MTHIFLQRSSCQGRASVSGLLERPAPTSVANRGPWDGLRSWPSPTSGTPCRSAVCCSASAGPQNAVAAPTAASARRRPARLPQSEPNPSREGYKPECCSSGRCRHGRVGAVVGGGQWQLIPREMASGAALVGSLCTAVTASQAAAEEVSTAAAAAAATAVGMPASGIDVTAAELAAGAVTSVVPVGYVPSPVEPGWEIWLGFVAGVVPFLIGSYEFGKRIIIQLRCEQCGGRGLVPSSGPGRDKYLRKCPQCGGFFPWISWKMFLTSTAAPGNGGPLQQPRGQTSVFYSVPDQPDPAKQTEARARSQAAIDALQARGRWTGQEQQEQQEEQTPTGEDGGAPASGASRAGGAAQAGREVAEARAQAGGEPKL
ncbi:hypothetical protein PLESTB_001589200 [Pleodorina starrii]|uniref:Uncharacterized protein n=1 Tax=Pleodorina starrii TaxID=330485 RepID=A0A9W6BYQ2_9CHLO|nr:hypothetical protein PLESTM_000581700 [Pleodorina starrii]GLC60235.1 hypothetical protein PLESTB_001589200 [Pleodorina starrii]GLC65997.1 hypothetical protein PLESTF_000370800 [Pleodorina starrii]